MLLRHQIRLRRPAADDEAGEFQPTMRDGFECQRGRVQRAEARLGDYYQLRADVIGQ